MKQAKKTITIIIILVFFSGCLNKYSEPNKLVLDFFDEIEKDLLLVVKVKKTKWTGFYPENKSCDQNKNCITLSYWYVYEAEVLDVLNGQYEQKRIKFALLSHADYLKEIKKEWYIHLKPFKNKTTSKTLGSVYYVENHSSEFSIN